MTGGLSLVVKHEFNDLKSMILFTLVLLVNLHSLESLGSWEGSSAVFIVETIVVL